MLSKHRCYTLVAHINTQSLPSSFDGFSLMMTRYQFDILAVSEAWLKDNKIQLEHLQINRYQYGKIESPKLHNICHSKYITT